METLQLKCDIVEKNSDCDCFYRDAAQQMRCESASNAKAITVYGQHFVIVFPWFNLM